MSLLEEYSYSMIQKSCFNDKNRMIDEVDKLLGVYGGSDHPVAISRYNSLVAIRKELD